MSDFGLEDHFSPDDPNVSIATRSQTAAQTVLLVKKADGSPHLVEMQLDEKHAAMKDFLTTCEANNGNISSALTFEKTGAGDLAMSIDFTGIRYIKEKVQ